MTVERRPETGADVRASAPSSPNAAAPLARPYVSEHDHEPSEPGEAKAPHEGSKALQACSHCGASFGRVSRVHRRHCSVRCRVAAHRARRGTPILYEREEGRR